MRGVVPAVCVATLAVPAASALADFVPGAALIDPAVQGASQYDGWIGLTSANYSGYGAFPGTAPWPGPIGSNRTAANTFNAAEPGDAGLIKVANGAGGGPFVAGSSVYFGGFSADANTFGGVLAVTDATPVANLENVVFQIQISEAWGYDFFDDALPTLSFNGGSQALAAANVLTIERLHNGTVEMPTGTEDLFINTYLLQWDLRGVAEPIDAFGISFAGVQHAQLYGLRLDQSDVYVPIPAPGAASLVALGLLAAARRRAR